MHLQSTYDPSLLLKFNSTTLQTWWCTWEVMYKHTFFPSPCCSDPHRTVLQRVLYLQRTLRMCKMIMRSLRRIASRYSHCPINSERRMTSDLVSLPASSFFCIMQKLKENSLVMWSVANISSRLFCAAKLYSWYSALGQVSAESHIKVWNIFRLEGVAPKITKRHALFSSYIELFFHGAH